jgi:steroid delta-isomerase-like uncharacterized protein
MKRLFLLIVKLVPFVVLLCFALSCQQQAKLMVTEEQSKFIGDQYMKARNEVNLDLLDGIYASDVVIHDPSQPEDIMGLDALKKYYLGNHAAFPDLKLTLEEIAVGGDRIVWVWTFTGTNTGPLGELPPTGNMVKFTGVAIDRVVDGKIVEEWVYYNVLDTYQQLGFTVTPPKE